MQQERLLEIRKKLTDGDNQWLVELYENYKQYCRATILSKKLCTSDEADEIFTEALIAIHNNVLSGKIQELKSEKTYLVNTCINIARNKNYHMSYAMKKAEEVRLLFYENQITYLEAGEDYQEQLIAKCRKAMSMLNDKCQKIIKAYYLDRMKMKQIADLLNLSSADVAKTLKSRCYKTLLEKIETLK